MISRRFYLTFLIKAITNTTIHLLDHNMIEMYESESEEFLKSF